MPRSFLVKKKKALKALDQSLQPQDVEQGKIFCKCMVVYVLNSN